MHSVYRGPHALRGPRDPYEPNEAEDPQEPTEPQEAHEPWAAITETFLKQKVHVRKLAPPKWELHELKHPNIVFCGETSKPTREHALPRATKID